mmetsp:Transcript_17679/g.50496  ORF Transcript_17679/g.50496 Transcript_17679/m.50496 type:complete len:727 (+) Transcript_17679:3532-5712(+)
MAWRVLATVSRGSAGARTPQGALRALSAAPASADLTRNIGISAHIDSGKTTLTERILYYTGRINNIHDVRGKDGVGAKMDSMDLEREKGITIQSAATHCSWNENHINIIDTPGHVDFTIEVERALRVLDGGVLVLCGVSGVQSQSLTVDRQMKRYDVPRVAFVNKLDRAGANPDKVVDQLREQMALHACAVQMPIGLSENHEGVVDLVKRVAYTFKGVKGEEVEETDVPASLVDEVEERRNTLIEAVADVDDALAELYLEGDEIDASVLTDAIGRATKAREFVPVFMGSAFKNKGVQPLLDAVVDYMPAPDDVEAIKGTSLDGETAMERISSDEEPFSALAFKIMTDPFVGTLTFCRIYSGILNAGDGVYNSVKGQRERVGRMLQMHANDRTEVKSAVAGDIIAVAGLKQTTTGETLCDKDNAVILEKMDFPEPVISVAVEAKSKKDQDKMGEALARLAAEDPSFRTKYDEENAQTIISGMGELHLEIIVDRLQREFGVEANVGAPQVSYREAITAPAEVDFTHKKQSGGSGQYARCKVQFEPLDGEESADFVFASEIKGGAVPKEYIPGVQKGIEDVLKTGVLAGYPVLGMKATLVDGAFHDVDSSVLAFEIAGRGCCREGLRKGKVRLMEPMMQVDVTTPEDYMGDVIGDINSRRGLVGDLGERGNAKTIRASVPLANMFQYVSTLRSISKGRASYSMKLASYDFVPPNVEKELMAKFTPSEED